MLHISQTSSSPNQYTLFSVINSVPTVLRGLSPQGMYLIIRAKKKKTATEVENGRKVENDKTEKQKQLGRCCLCVASQRCLVLDVGEEVSRLPSRSGDAGQGRLPCAPWQHGSGSVRHAHLAHLSLAPPDSYLPVSPFVSFSVSLSGTCALFECRI